MEDYRAVVEAEGLAFHAVRPGNREMEAAGLDRKAVSRPGQLRDVPGQRRDRRRPVPGTIGVI